MDNILIELWRGNIVPFEQFCRHDPVMEQMSKSFYQSRDQLMATMTDEQKELLEAYDTCQLDLESESEEQAFAYGFRLGARLCAAVMATQTGE